MDWSGAGDKQQVARCVALDEDIQAGTWREDKVTGGLPSCGIGAEELSGDLGHWGRIRFIQT